MTKKTKVIRLISVAILLILVFPYIKAEFLTMKYGNEFENQYLQTGMMDGIEYFKLLNYIDDVYAEVFYVAEEHSSGNCVTFYKRSYEEWEMIGWNTIWSKTGSADGFMWPYYR